jgi:FlaG/FlaF family flagellin (archaellin)
MGTFVARCGRSDKVFTPVLGAVLLVALTALLASTLGAYGLGAGLVEPGPHVAVDGEPVVAYDHDDGDREQRLRLVHEGGTPVPVSELELIVTVPRTGDRARMGGFPVASNKLDPAQVDGSEFLDTSHSEAVGSLSHGAPDRDGVWRAGDRLGLRINGGVVRLAPGATVVVRVVHTGSGQVVAETTLTAG